MVILGTQTFYVKWLTWFSITFYLNHEITPLKYVWLYGKEKEKEWKMIALRKNLIAKLYVDFILYVFGNIPKVELKRIKKKKKGKEKERK